MLRRHPLSLRAVDCLQVQRPLSKEGLWLLILGLLVLRGYPPAVCWSWWLWLWCGLAMPPLLQWHRSFLLLPSLVSWGMDIRFPLLCLWNCFVCLPLLLGFSSGFLQNEEIGTCQLLRKCRSRSRGIVPLLYPNVSSGNQSTRISHTFYMQIFTVVSSRAGSICIVPTHL